MILFVSEYPGPQNEKDGMMQRVSAIDGHFAGHERVYLKVSFIRHLLAERRQVAPGATALRLNFFLHLPFIIALVIRARIIYVHSVGNALALLPVYAFKRVVTDLHGAVPEEFRMAGKTLAAWRYELVERIAVRFSWRLVAVSAAMVEHIRSKHRQVTAPFLTIPIFDDVPPGERAAGGHELPLTVIYAGGTQPWQNVDLMLDAMGATKSSCRLHVLTGDEETFREKTLARGLSDRVRIASVSKRDVYDHYRRADLGFVLRDDTPVNRVSCPTKLIEYLSCGVVPIVLQPRIGDFAARGYAYVTLDDFLSGALPPAAELERMRSGNYRVIAALREEARSEMSRLVALCTAEGDARG